MGGLLVLVVIRALFQGVVHLISPPLPFLVVRESRDVLEYLAHSAIDHIHWFEGYVPFIFPLTSLIRDYDPAVSPVAVVKVLIYLVDIATGTLWYLIVEKINNVGLNRNLYAKGYGFVSKPLFIAGLHMLNPFTILYNEGCNSDGVRYFWVSLAIYSALLLYGKRTGGVLRYLFFQFATCGLILNGSFKMLAAMLPLTYLVVYKKLQLSYSLSLGWSEFKLIMRAVLPHVLVTISLYILCDVIGNHSTVYHLLDLDYKGRGSGIDYSLYWYLHRGVPSPFDVVNIFKAHMVVFLLPLPLLVVLRHRPMEYVIAMLNIAILQQPRLSLVGLWFMICLFAVHYPLMDKGLAFTKMMLVLLAAVIGSVVAYVSWVGRYIATPNYYFAPQMVIFMIMCMVLEDYITVNFNMWRHSSTPEKCS